jgi:hypothetical protein
MLGGINSICALHRGPFHGRIARPFESSFVAFNEPDFCSFLSCFEVAVAICRLYNILYIIKRSF